MNDEDAASGADAQPQRPEVAPYGGLDDAVAAPAADDVPPQDAWWSRPMPTVPPAAPTYPAPPSYATHASYPSGLSTGGFAPTPVPPTPARRTRTLPSLLVVALVAALVGAAVGAGVVAATKKTTTRVASAGVIPASAVPTAISASQPAAPLPSGSIGAVASALLPAVVSITVTSGAEVDEGTGIVLSTDGLILTNNHVVESAARTGVIAASLNDGRTVRATIIGRDPTSDLAVIRAQNVTDLHTAQLGSDGALTVGQQVIAIGSPLGLSNTVTSGIVSSLNRPVCTQNCDGTGAGVTPTVLDAIQTDAAINPGNSGGPLVNMAGQVVGINSAIATVDQQPTTPNAEAGNIGVGFAIPIDDAKRIVNELERNGRASHAVLGVGVDDSFDPSLHTPNGAKVVNVTSGGPAAQAGLQVGDVIVKMGNRVIVDSDSLIAATHAATPDASVQISYLRGTATARTQLTLGSAISS